MYKGRLAMVTAVLLLAGCATGMEQQATRHADSSQNRQLESERRKAAQALKKDGIDAGNLLYWRRMTVGACYDVDHFALPQEDPVAAARQAEQDFGPLAGAFRPFYLVAGQSGGAVAELPKSARWEGFAAGFNRLKLKMEQSRNGAGASPLREEFLAMLGGVVGQTPRWQLWFADRFATGLTLRSFLAAGRESAKVVTEHWAETDAGNYATGQTKDIFGKSWQPKGWAVEDRRAVAAFGRFIAALADESADAENRGARAAAVLDDFGRDETSTDASQRPHVCEPLVREGVLAIQTPEDYRRYDREDEKPAERRSKKRGGLQGSF